MNAKLTEKLRDVSARLSDLARRITDEVSPTWYSEDEKNYFASLHNLVLDDITYVDSIADAVRLGYLIDAQETLAAIEVTVNSDPHAKYNPVMAQLRCGNKKALEYILRFVCNVRGDASFRDMLATLSKRLDRPEDVKVASVPCNESVEYLLSFTNDDGLECFVTNYQDLLVYLSAATRGFLFLGTVRAVETAAELVESADHACDVAEENLKQTAVYEELFDKVDPTRLENQLRDALYRIAVLSERISIIDYGIRDKIATHTLETDKAIEIASATVNRRTDDNIIVGMVAVILLFFIILSFLH